MNREKRKQLDDYVKEIQARDMNFKEDRGGPSIGLGHIKRIFSMALFMLEEDMINAHVNKEFNKKERILKDMDMMTKRYIEVRDAIKKEEEERKIKRKEEKESEKSSKLDSILNSYKKNGDKG